MECPPLNGAAFARLLALEQGRSPTWQEEQFRTYCRLAVQYPSTRQPAWSRWRQPYNGCPPPAAVTGGDLEAQHRRILGQHRMDHSPQHRTSFAMNNPYAQDMPLPAGAEIFCHNRAGITRIKRVQVKDSVKRIFN